MQLFVLRELSHNPAHASRSLMERLVQTHIGCMMLVEVAGIQLL
jgi:hypothetical protein